MESARYRALYADGGLMICFFIYTRSDAACFCMNDTIAGQLLLNPNQLKVNGDLVTRNGR